MKPVVMAVQERDATWRCIGAHDAKGMKFWCERPHKDGLGGVGALGPLCRECLEAHEDAAHGDLRN